jgi:hypothetical protein
MQEVLHDAGSQWKSTCPATRALETMLQEEKRDRTKIESQSVQALYVNRKRRYDMAGLYHAVCEIQLHDLDLGFPSVEWCSDDDDRDCVDCNDTLANQLILENASVPLAHYEKRMKLQSGEAPYLVRTKSLPVGLSLLGLSDDVPPTKTQCSNQKSSREITSAGGMSPSNSHFP